MVAGRQPARHRGVPAARTPGRVLAGGRPPSKSPTTSSASASETWPGALDGVRRRRRQPVRRADEVRPQSLMSYRPIGNHPVRLRGPDDVDELLALIPRDDRRRPRPAVRGHRLRRGHRLAVHRLGGGTRAPQPGRRLLRAVGRSRDPVNRPRSSPICNRASRPVGRRRRVRRRRHECGDRVPATRPRKRSSTATA